MKADYFLKNVKRDVRLHLLDLLYPGHCPFCGKEDTRAPRYFCEECEGKLSPPEEWGGFYPMADFRAATAYDELSKKALFGLKENNDGCAVIAAAELIFRRLVEQPFALKADIITFIPTDKEKLLDRGYNHSRLIAKRLARLMELPYVSMLTKIRCTEEQKNMKGLAARRENIKGAFAFTGKTDVFGKNVILIDDVCTTGSTLREATEQLLKAGAANVYGVVFAKRGRNIIKDRQEL